jgi:nucleoid-associated protein YgaU
VAARGDAPVRESEQVVVIAVPEPRSPLPQPGSAKNVAEARAAAQPVAVLLDRDSRGKGRVLQAPGRLSAEGTLALMTVSYDEGGKILLSGEAPPGVPVRIYVDNRPAALVVGNAKGAWSSGVDQALEPGTYTLRLDQLDAKGQAVARIETPFTRVSEPPIPGQLQVDYVVVQPGNSLWRIARRLSGKGLDYVYIYGVNQGQIRNPDLIYPGQVFEIPSEIGVAG